MKYSHSKTGNSLKYKTRQDGSVNIPRGLKHLEKRKVDNHKTVERMFGHFNPNFGSSLGVSYDGVNGFITKVGRSESIV